MLTRTSMALRMVVVGLLFLGGIATAEAPAVKVLFLGDQGAHKPADRAQELIPAMARQGIEITYTENISDLNPNTLGQYDALILYANIDTIEEAPLKALLDYVEEGGGFVPLHCASWCFRNAPEFVALVGGQFSRHGTGDFVAEIVNREHPITEPMLEFITWDETYVHTHHAADRQILMVRKDEEGEEPYTWTRIQGKGRVFYTAYGHDARTFTNPGFHELVGRGIRWAAGKLPASPAKEPFEYKEAKIAFYPPKDAPGIVQEAPTQMQLPLSPDESLKHMRLPSGFDAQLYAAEPDIVKVIAMNWDERGRLWLAETIDYPNDMQVPPNGNDRIRICEDTDGDGLADKFTIFADKLSIPTGLIHANGGLIVVQAPDTLFLRDTDGDDVADERKVLFSGWGTADTHSGPSFLRLGLDNWIWCTVGYSGFNGVVGDGEHAFRMGVVRFKADGSDMEFIAATDNNTWGLGFSETGEVFASTANGNHSDHVPIPNRFFESIRGYTGSSGAVRIFDHKHIHPITPNVRQVDWHEQYTAASGYALYTARTYPEFYWNRVAFVTEPTGHLIHQCIHEEQGSGYISRDGWNFLASTDEWTSPVVAEIGPDGNVWVSDWYNYIVQHNPTPAGFENGKGNAYITPLRDKTHGRIYRVTHEDSPQVPLPNLAHATDEALIESLSHPNMFWRSTAQRILVEEQRTNAVSALVALLLKHELDAIGNAPGPLHALAALEGLGFFQNDNDQVREAFFLAFAHPAPAVRSLAAQFVNNNPEQATHLLGLLDDPDPKVRRNAFLALAELEPSKNVIGTEIAKQILSRQNRNDRWIRAAALPAAARHAEGFLMGMAQQKKRANLEMVQVVANHYARGETHPMLYGLLFAMRDGSPEVNAAWLTGLAEGWKGKLPDESKADIEKILTAITDSLNDDALLAVVTLAKRWDIEGDFTEKLQGLITRYAETLQDEDAEDKDRIQAAKKMVELDSGKSTRSAILAQVTPNVSLELSAGLIQALQKDPAPSTARDLLARFDTFLPTTRSKAIDVLLTRPQWSIQLLVALQKSTITEPTFTVVQKNLLLDSQDTKVKDLARQVLVEAAEKIDQSRAEIVEALLPLIHKKGDVALGKQVYEENCIQCHAFNGSGGNLGPDLTGIAGGNKEEILIAIVDPNRSVEGNFRQWSVVTKDGDIWSGLLTDETQTAFTIYDALGNGHPVLREDVNRLIMSPNSVMPEGFESLPEDMMIGLLEYLTQVGEYLPMNLSKVSNTVSTLPMFHEGASREKYNEQLIFESWGTQTFEGIPYFITDPKGSSTPNLIMLHGATTSLVKAKPKSVKLPCGRAAKAIHLLSGVSGWGFPIGDKGSHTMTVRLHFRNGEKEDHILKNGIHFADYIRGVDVPESKLAFMLGPRQLRQLSIYPQQDSAIETIEFIDGGDQSAPMVMAVTLELNH